MLKLIREEEPPTPSSRISTSNTDTSVASNRKTEVEKLGRDLRGELDWIVLKALSKDRDRRYDSANGFADDIARYLNCEPVLAGPPSQLYRFQKFVRRHKGRVLAAALLLAALIAGVAGTTAGMMAARNEAKQKELARAEESRQRKIAEENAKLAQERLEQVEREKQRAEQEKNRAEAESQIASAVKYFLKEKLLLQASTSNQARALEASGDSTTKAIFDPKISELLDRAARELDREKIETFFPRQPLVQAEILQTVGDAYRGFGQPQTAVDFLVRAEELFREHLGPKHKKSLDSLFFLAHGLDEAGRFAEALPLWERLLQFKREATQPDDEELLHYMDGLAGTYANLGQLTKALELHEEVLRIARSIYRADDAILYQKLSNVAKTYDLNGRYAESLALFEESADFFRAKIGAEHPRTILILNNLAYSYLQNGQDSRATPILEEILKVYVAKHGPDHPLTILITNNLAANYWSLNRLKDSIPLFERLFARARDTLGVNHPRTIEVAANLGINYRDAERYSEAIPLLESVYRASRTQPQFQWIGSELIDAYVVAGQFDAARSLINEYEVNVRRAYPEESVLLADELALLGIASWI